MPATKKGPIVITVISNHASVQEALMSAKKALLTEKFIASNGIQETSFTATRTTGSKSDYYVADVIASKEDVKMKITITFVKVGTGLLKLSKVADKIKATLESKE